MNDHWGKNCFNSSFPAATASYMMEHDISIIYIHLDIVKGKLAVITAPDGTVKHMLNACESNEELAVEKNIQLATMNLTGREAEDIVADFEFNEGQYP